MTVHLSQLEVLVAKLRYEVRDQPIGSCMCVWFTSFILHHLLCRRPWSSCKLAVCSHHWSRNVLYVSMRVSHNVCDGCEPFTDAIWPLICAQSHLHLLFLSFLFLLFPFLSPSSAPDESFVCTCFCSYWRYSSLVFWYYHVQHLSSISITHNFQLSRRRILICRLDRWDRLNSNWWGSNGDPIMCWQFDTYHYHVAKGQT